jgi:hypothetical protein
MRVANSIPLGRPLPDRLVPVNAVQTLKVHRAFWAGVPALVRDGVSFTLMKLSGGRLGAGSGAGYGSLT